MGTFLDDFQRVSRRDRCPVCDKPDGCLVRRDDGAVACRTVASDREMQTAPPTWLHGGNTGPDWRDTPKKTDPISYSILESPPAAPDPERLDHGLRALLDACPLIDEHREQLRRRGLTDPEIDSLPFGSLPAAATERRAIAAAIVSRLGDVAFGAVPGLYRKANQPALAGASGLLIGVLQRGRIVGMVIRPDQQTKGKYIWLSSRDRDGGCASGAPCAVLVGDDDGAEPAIITEGILKGLIVHVRSGRSVVAMPGAGITASVAGHLGDLSAPGALLAYDTDRTTNPAVADAEARLIAALHNAGYPTHRLTWGTRFKGLDDALAAGRIPVAEPVAPPERIDPERVTVAEGQARAAEGRRARLARAIQATGLASTEKQSIISLFTHVDGVRRDQPDVTEIEVPNAHVAEHVGVGAQTAGRHLENCQQLVDAATGELVQLYHRRVDWDPARRQNMTLYAPCMSYDDMLDFLPHAIPLAKDGTAKPKRGHGGPGRRFCSDHPTATIVRRVSFHCGECDREVDREPDTREKPDPIGYSILESPQPETAPSTETAAQIDSSLEYVPSASILESGQTYTSPGLDAYRDMTPGDDQHGDVAGATCVFCQGSMPADRRYSCVACETTMAEMGAAS